MKIIITGILTTEVGAFNGLTKITFDFTGPTGIDRAYLFCKPGNEPKVGDELDGDISKDKAGNNKFTKAKPPQAYPSSPAPRSGERVFKADPDKQESIEWQACLKAAVEATRDFYMLTGNQPDDLAAYKLDIVNAVVTFTQTIEHKPDHPIELHHDADQPPVETYDQIPTVDELGELSV